MIGITYSGQSECRQHRDRVANRTRASHQRKIASSGRVLDVLVGPAVTGKSRTMSGLRTEWERVYGPGSVIGLAPSAAAAEVLGDEQGSRLRTPQNGSPNTTHSFGLIARTTLAIRRGSSLSTASEN